MAAAAQRKSPRLSAGGAKENAARKSTGLNKTVEVGRKSGGKAGRGTLGLQHQLMVLKVLT